MTRFHRRSIPRLKWRQVRADHFKAEPLPGYVFRVVKNPGGVGWLYYLPGRDAEATAMEGVAQFHCEEWWREAFADLLDAQA